MSRISDISKIQKSCIGITSADETVLKINKQIDAS